MKKKNISIFDVSFARWFSELCSLFPFFFYSKHALSLFEEGMLHLPLRTRVNCRPTKKMKHNTVWISYKPVSERCILALHSVHKYFNGTANIMPYHYIVTTASLRAGDYEWNGICVDSRVHMILNSL